MSGQIVDVFALLAVVAVPVVVAGLVLLALNRDARRDPRRDARRARRGRRRGGRHRWWLAVAR